MKKTLTLTLAFLCALTLAACGNAAQPTQTPADESTAPAEQTQSEQPQEAEEPISVSAKASVNDYTWEELASIAQEISASGSESSAMEVAKQYNLCDENGSLSADASKQFTLEDGTAVSAQIVGIYHDNKADGGKAGLTFIFGEPIAERVMDSSLPHEGGWETSDLRAWLASDGMTLLPEDLRGIIVPVEKLTNNVGITDSVSSVTPTTDQLWLFSLVEIYGPSTTFDGEVYEDILDAEGSQYQLYADAGVTDVSEGEEKSALLNRGEGVAAIWWLRTPIMGGTTMNGAFYGVNALGGGQGFPADQARYVVPGFCL